MPARRTVTPRPDESGRPTAIVVPILIDNDQDKDEERQSSRQSSRQRMKSDNDH
jgi:hypothetical protein